MSNPYNSPQFKKLAELWNKKLEDSGHEEIEDFTLAEPPLKRNEASLFKSIDPTYYNTTVLYYAKARDLLNTFDFKTELHRQIWELHSEGVSVREIARALNQKKVKRSTVHNVLKQLKREVK